MVAKGKFADTSAHEKLKKARAGLILDQPFWGTISLRLDMLEDTTCETGWTDGKSVGYQPDFIHSLTLGQCKTFLAHEAGGHVGLCHHTRRGERDKDRWNRAGDYVVNILLDEAGFEPIDGWLLDYQYKGMSVEQVYSLLTADEAGGGDGSGSGDGNGSSNDPGNCGEVRDATDDNGGPLSQQGKADVEAQVMVDLQQAAKQAKKWGNFPSGLGQLVEEMCKPRIHWKEVLRRFVDQHAATDYSWSVPNKRYMSMGIYLPSLHNEDEKHIAVAIDTSGSTYHSLVKTFSNELDDMVHSARAHVTAIYCDRRVAGVEEFTPDDEVVLHLAGGGGTSFIPPFEEVEARGLNPVCFIYLTDGECYEFPEAPSYPVLWCKFGYYPFTPPFGEVIDITEW